MSAEALIYIAKWLVVIVVSLVQAVQVVKPCSRLADFALVQCLLRLDAVLKLCT